MVKTQKPIQFENNCGAKMDGKDDDLCFGSG